MMYPVERLEAVIRGQDKSIPAAAAMMALPLKQREVAAATGMQAAQQQPQPTVRQQMTQAAEPQMPAQMQQQVQAQEQTESYKAPEKNWQGQWVDELKQPILVAILFFVITLPAVHLLVSHYAPTLLGPGGNFTTMGNVARALCSGGLYWVLQRVVAPLLSI
jgi:hypothetical protein